MVKVPANETPPYGSQATGKQDEMALDLDENDPYTRWQGFRISQLGMCISLFLTTLWRRLLRSSARGPEVSGRGFPLRCNSPGLPRRRRKQLFQRIHARQAIARFREPE